MKSKYCNILAFSLETEIKGENPLFFVSPIPSNKMDEYSVIKGKFSIPIFFLQFSLYESKECYQFNVKFLLDRVKVS
jgi:hypothetical protein